MAAEIAGSTLSTANLAEVVGKLVAAGLDGSRLRQLLGAAGVTFEPLSAADAEPPARCDRSTVAGPSPWATAAAWR